MTAVAHRVQFHQASCRGCRRTFLIPALGDQSFGQFIFHGVNGSAFGFLSALEEPVWNDIEARLRGAGLFTTPDSRRQIEHLQRVVAASADPIGGQTLLLYPICPGCRSRSIDYGDSDPLEIREVPGVTFRQYQLLSEDRKTESLQKLWTQCA